MRLLPLLAFCASRPGTGPGPLTGPSALPVPVCDANFGGSSVVVETPRRARHEKGGSVSLNGPSAYGTGRPERMSRRVVITSATTTGSFS
jgi:hypothetical protein